MSGHKLYGNNRHFFKGKFISGPDCRSCCASFMMILVPSILWQIESGPFYTDRYTVLIPFVTGILQVMSLTFLVCTAFADPGIMPRQKEYTEAFDQKKKMSRTKPPPRYHDLVLRGHPFKIKWCTTCNIYRPPRCTHCSVCENCIERFDHHCPWLGNCIGKRNYWLFFSFVSTTGALNVMVLGTAVGQLAVIAQEFKEMGKGGGDAFLEAMKEEPLAVALAIYAAAIVWFTVGLCLYHSYLICTNQTTYEQIKGVYSNGTNPFYRGIVGNCQDILFNKVRPRYFNAWENDQRGALIWKPTPCNEAAREIRLPSGRGEKRYMANGAVPFKGPRDGAEDHTAPSVSNDPFLTIGAAAMKKQENETSLTSGQDGSQL